MSGSYDSKSVFLVGRYLNKRYSTITLNRHEEICITIIIKFIVRSIKSGIKSFRMNQIIFEVLIVYRKLRDEYVAKHGKSFKGLKNKPEYRHINDKTSKKCILYLVMLGYGNIRQIKRARVFFPCPDFHKLDWDDIFTNGRAEGEKRNQLLSAKKNKDKKNGKIQNEDS